jgi:hypothetical protein
MKRISTKEKKGKRESRRKKERIRKKSERKKRKKFLIKKGRNTRNEEVNTKKRTEKQVKDVGLRFDGKENKKGEK